MTRELSPRAPYGAVMTAPDPSGHQRLYGAMQMLMRYHANAEPLPEGESRGIVSRADAQEALIQLAAVIDESAQAGGIPVERACWAAAMVMVLQECVHPLPAPYSPRSADPLAEDLLEVVTAMRQFRAPDTVPDDL